MSRRRIVGHERQRAGLTRLLRSASLPSALVFSGPAGIGKSLVAKALAATLLCEDAGQDLVGCLKCNACRLVETGNHPDLISFDCSDREYSKMENVRELLHRLHLRAFNGNKRAVVFNNAEHLSIQATNALLKAVEEPRAGTHFILVTSNHSRLPPTLLSRCQLWFFDSLSQEQIAAVLKEQPEVFHDAKLSDLGITADELVLLTDGSLDSIEHIIDRLDDWRMVTSTLDQIAAGDLSQALHFAKDLAREKNSLRERLGLMRIHARRRMNDASDWDEQYRWSIFITNLISTERLAFERNLGAVYCLNNCFLDLSSRSFTRLTNDDRILDHITL
ncbi:MAG: AAA family ATPase [Bdellovibrionales bacterium]|nr:AAA family ATPase [Bdellovibrionales bacterium]